MKILFLRLFSLVPSAARQSASSLPVVPLCPFIHSNEVIPALFLILLTIGFRRFVWVMCMKSTSVCLSMFLHSAFIDQSESVLMWSLVLLGVSFRAMWIARSSAELFDWGMFFPTGAFEFFGLLVPNQTLMPALAFVLPFRLQDLGSRLAVSVLCLEGVVKILRLSWIRPVVVSLGSKILTLSGEPITFLVAASLSSLVMPSLRRWSSSCGLNLGFMSLRSSLAWHLGVCVCVVSFVTPWSCDMATVQQPYGYMWYIGFVIHISGRNVQLGGRGLWWGWSGG